MVSDVIGALDDGVVAGINEPGYFELLSVVLGLAGIHAKRTPRLERRRRNWLGWRTLCCKSIVEIGGSDSVGA